MSDREWDLQRIPPYPMLHYKSFIIFMPLFQEELVQYAPRPGQFAHHRRIVCAKVKLVGRLYDPDPRAGLRHHPTATQRSQAGKSDGVRLQDGGIKLDYNLSDASTLCTTIGVLQQISR